MNKKGQLQQSGGRGAHPVLIIGIIIFVIPFFNGVFKWNLPKWISGLGIIVILLGAVLSIIQNMD